MVLVNRFVRITAMCSRYRSIILGSVIELLLDFVQNAVTIEHLFN